jgi:hypothetical protein
LLLKVLDRDGVWTEERLEVRAAPYALGRLILRYSTNGDLTMKVEESEYAVE